MLDMLVSGVVLFALDQWSKRVIATHATTPIVLAPRVILRHVASRKFFYASAAARAAFTITWLAAVTSVAILHSSGIAVTTRGATVGAGMAIGGAAGNLLEILRTRSVTDFVAIGWWPAFNIADAAIISGLVLALWPA